MPQLQYVDPIVLDRGLLFVVAATTRVVLTPALPESFTNASATMLGFSPVILAGPRNAEGGGREVFAQPINNGTVSKDGLAAFWAFLADDTQRLLVATELELPRDLLVTQGFTLETVAFRFPSGLILPAPVPAEAR